MAVGRTSGGFVNRGSSCFCNVLQTSMQRLWHLSCYQDRMRHEKKQAVGMAKSVWRIGLGGLGVLLILVFPVYAQKDANDAEFSFERLADLEKELAASTNATEPALLVKNATNGVSEAASGETEEASGDEAVVPAVASGRSFNMWRSVGALLIILGGLIVANKWLHGRFAGRTTPGGAQEGRRMQVQERLSIDHRRQLMLVTVGERELVLAVGPNEMHAVGSWDRAGAAAGRNNEVAK